MFSGTAAKVLDALQAYQIKEETPGHYRSNSPLRPGSNSHGFTLTLDDNEHGAYFDHVSNDTGSLYELARRLGITIEIPAGIAVPDTKRAYAGIEDYAKAHGISGEYLKYAGWFEVIHQKRPALGFRTATGTRYRFLDGKKPHYVSGKGYQRCWYGLTPGLSQILAKTHSLVVCNGEISTVVARRYGVAAICVTAGEKAIPPDLMQELKTFLGPDDETPPVIVAFDCDETGQRAGRLVAAQLKESGLIAKAVDLGLGRGGDLADFCMLHGEGVHKALNAAPGLPPADPFGDLPQKEWKIIAASELKNLPPVKWIIPGEIPEQSLVVIYGESGAGKSFVGLDYALRVAQEHTVVYIPTEGEWGYRKRVAAWCQHHHQAEGKLFFIMGSITFFERMLFDLLMEDLANLKPYMLVVDTLAMAMTGGDENSARDMGIILKACRRIQHTVGATVVLIHHVGKTGVSERGSTALRGNADTMIRVSPIDDLIMVECSKTKDEKPFEQRYLKLLPVTVTGVGESMVPILAAKVIRQESDPLTTNQRKILEALALEANSDGIPVRDLQEFTGLSLGAIMRALSTLLNFGLVHKPDRSYAITDKGRTAITPKIDPVDPQIDPLDPKLIRSVFPVDPVDPHDPHIFCESDHDQKTTCGSTGSTGSTGSSGSNGSGKTLFEVFDSQDTYYSQGG